jgi:hypothetical protein
MKICETIPSELRASCFQRTVATFSTSFGEAQIHESASRSKLNRLLGNPILTYQSDKTQTIATRIEFWLGYPESRVYFIVLNTLFGILATTSYLGSTNSAMSYFSVEAKSIATSLSLSL